DALLPYPAVSTDNADRNFWGPSRGNINNYRQTQFIVNLMNGTQFGGTPDPRMASMLSPSPDGSFRGLDPNLVGFGALTAQTAPQITATQKATFLASPNIVPATITLSHIMSQKFIAQWAWGHNEVWMDMRRYHYTDLDPVSGVEIFRGFAAPTNLFPDNGGK